MKYLLLLLGVAQAKDLLLKRRLSSEISWDIIEDDVKTGEGSAPCPLSDDAVHAAMCGRALSSGGSSDSGSDGSASSSVTCELGSGKCESEEAYDYDFDSLKNCIDYTEHSDYRYVSFDGTTCRLTNSCDSRDNSNYMSYDRTLAEGKCAEQQSGSSGSGPSQVNCHGYDNNESGCDSQSACSWVYSTQKCHSSASSDSGPSCPKTVVADFQAGNDDDYTISIDGDTPQLTSARSQITLCEGDTLSVTRSTGFTDHPLLISDTDDNPVLNSNTGDVTGLSPGDYPYRCTLTGHESMAGIVKVLPSSDSQCACDSSSSDGPSGLPTCTYRYTKGDCDNREDGRTCVWDGSSCGEHPCDTITSCEGDLVKKSPYPDASSLNLDNYVYFAQCCKPVRKGCKDDPTSYTYDPTVDVHNSSFCFTQKSEADKAADFVDKTTYLAKRGVRKGHAKEAFYKKRAEGSTKKAAIRAAREIIPYDDLPQRVKDRKRATVKVAVAVNDATIDTCQAGVDDDNCVSLDLAEDRVADETTILLTEDEDRSWAVVADGQDIIIKQTRSGDKFTLQCWVPEHSDWSSGPSKSPSTDDNIVTHKCGSHVFMVGSLQEVCVDCADGCDEAAGLCYVPGCTDDNVETPACNYNNLATVDDGSCVYPDATQCRECQNGDAVTLDCANGCDGSTGLCYVPGCTDDNVETPACNYNNLATLDDGTCTYAAENFNCNGDCLVDTDCAGTCGGSAVDEGCGCGQTCDSEDDDTEDVDGDDAGDNDTCVGANDSCSCHKLQNNRVKYIEKQCCNESPADCSTTVIS